MSVVLEQMAAEQLYAEVHELFRTASEPEVGRTLVDLVEREWPQICEREANPEDAETCRLTQLAVLQMPPADYESAAVWRMRALTRAVRCGWTEAVATMLMGEALRALSLANSDFPGGARLQQDRGF